MKSLKSIKDSYTKKYSEHKIISDSIQAKIEQREKQLLRLKKKETLHRGKYVSWVDEICMPIANEFMRRYPQYKLDGELRTYGLGCRCPLTFFINPERKYEQRFKRPNCVSITIVPADLPNITYETGETKKDYRDGTLGSLNGFNNITKEVESIEEIMQFLELQITGKKTKKAA